MNNSIKRFRESFVRIKNIDALYLHLTNQLSFNESDLGDLLRSQVVYCVSAFDRFIHDITKAGMLEIFSGNRMATPSYLKFSIPVEVYNNINTGIVSPEILFAQHIQNSHSYQSFQDADKISTALSLFWDEHHKWQKIANKMEISITDLKVELSNIVIRRNQIAHESDVDLYSGGLQSINHNDSIRMVEFIEKLGESIYTLI
ncbi:MAG: hypothetical protein CO098_11670 [Bacteroidetes bacterium CG_4_9_14_3_um_filter_41_19]|nr:MAG: hypothetical protein CO098_11670 [Bacteroidetes bacterium CG_4_9_14_3_um_filter_41_19]